MFNEGTYTSLVSAAATAGDFGRLRRFGRLRQFGICRFISRAWCKTLVRHVVKSRFSRLVQLRKLRGPRMNCGCLDSNRPV